ncbi:MDR family MFS transporter [Pseudactinotalea suaedae]|uniref:MDR family MFS transporter n=1 Tax=Pseudactinotalea suaedae TaxID=1524924 RepID=UPI0012E2D710|nr:MDR family MFS transporter [Pseudactinotalea suaedae]
MSSTSSTIRASRQAQASDETPEAAGAGAPAAFHLTPAARAVFIGLLIGMFVAAISQTIVSPALPIIVAELGGMEHYSWLATSAMLASAVVVPVVGKLSDLYGRRPFYVAGLVVFMVGAVLSGLATNFWWLVGARVIQGLGMGTLMPLSQVIIGDLIPPRHRGKYQGIMGAVFGICSIAGPLAGGFITDHFGWRWLFFVGVPFGLVGLVFIAKNLHLPHSPRKAIVDVWGIITLTVALVAILLATSWGGTTYPWSDWHVLGLFGVGAVALVAFVLIERRAAEPVIPLRLFRNPTFTFSNIASLAVAMGMFGAIFYIPVYAQGVLKANATSSGAIVMPMSVAMIALSIVIGMLITRTGKYKAFMVAGTVLMIAGFVLLTQLHYGSSYLQLIVAMVVLGLGLGATMQTYTLVVQNTSEHRDLGVATSATQFFRSAGGTVGIAVLGTVMAGRLQTAIGDHLDPAAAAQLPEGTSIGIDAVLDPEVLAQLPDPIEEAIRLGLADALHQVFLVAIPLVVVAFLATLFIKAVPLRDTLHEAPKAEEPGESAVTAEVAAGAAHLVDDEVIEDEVIEDEVAEGSRTTGKA